MATTVALHTNPLPVGSGGDCYYVLPRYVVGLKHYSGRMAGYWSGAESTRTDINGLTYRECIKAIGADFICASDSDHTDSDWAAIRDLNFWLADNTGVASPPPAGLVASPGCGASPAFMINTKDCGTNYGGNGQPGNPPPIYGYQTTPSNDNVSPGPASPGIDALSTSPWSPAGLYAKIKAYVDHFAGDLSRIPIIEIVNEPATMTQGKLGASHAWYTTDSEACERFSANQARLYSYGADGSHGIEGLGAADGHPGLGVKIASGSCATGADPMFHVADRNGGTSNTPALLDQWINGYNNFFGWRWGNYAQFPNTRWIKIYSNHAYTGIGVATANTGPIQDILNQIFFDETDGNPEALVTFSGSPVNYTKTKGGYKYSQKKWRAALDAAAGGTGLDVRIAGTEQWPWSDMYHDGKEAMTDLAGFFAAMEQAGVMKLAAYSFAGGMVAADGAGGVHDYNGSGTTGWPGQQGSPVGGNAFLPNDAHFSYYGGKLRRTTRVWSIQDFASRVNHTRPKNLCNVTVTGQATPAGGILNSLTHGTRCFHTVSTDGLYGVVELMNTHFTSTDVVTITFDRTVTSVSNGKLLQYTTAWDTAPANQALVVTGGNTITFTMPAGSALAFDVQYSGAPTGTAPVNTVPQVISGTAQVGQTLTTTTGTFTGSPSSYTKIFQSADNQAFTTNVTQIDSGNLTYVLLAAQNGKWIRSGVTATNASGTSTPVTYSNVLGPVAGNGGGGPGTRPTLRASWEAHTTVSSAPVFQSQNSWAEFAATNTRSFTTPSGLNNSIMIATTSIEAYGTTTEIFNNLSYNGVAMTLLGRAQGSSGYAVEVWYLLSPTAGAHNFIWNKVGGSRNLCTAVAVYSDVDQLRPFTLNGAGGTPNFIPSTGTTIGTVTSTLVSTSVNSLVVSALGGQKNPNTVTPTPGASQTARIDRTTSLTMLSVSDKPDAAGGSATLTETLTSATAVNWAYILFELGAVQGSNALNVSTSLVSGDFLTATLFDAHTVSLVSGYPTAGGVQMTAVDTEIDYLSGPAIQAFYKSNPGTGNVAVQANFPTSRAAVLVVEAWQDADPAGPIGPAVKNSTLATSLTLTAVTATNDTVAGFITEKNLSAEVAPTDGASQAQPQSVEVWASGYYTRGTASTKNAAGASTAISWSRSPQASEGLAGVAFAIKAVATPAGAFGHDVIGAFHASFGHEYRVGVIGVADSTAITAVKAYISGATTGVTHLRAFLYATSSPTVPSSFIAVGAAQPVAQNQAAGWQTFPVAASGLTIGTKYTLGLWSENGPFGVDQIELYYDTGISTDGHFILNAYSATDPPANPWGVDSTEAHLYSMYCISSGLPPPNVSVNPVLAGLNIEGQTLTCDNGTATQFTSLSKVWRIESAIGSGIYQDISPSQTGNSYATVQANYNKKILCLVTYSGPGGDLAVATLPSAPTIVVPTNLTIPTIVGVGAEGQHLTASAGTWNYFDQVVGQVFRNDYQWQSGTAGGGSPTNIVGATGTQYTVLHSQVSGTIRVGVTATNGAGTSSITYSAWLDIAALALPKFETLVDPFESFDGAKWTLRQDTGTTFSVASGIAALGIGTVSQSIVELESVDNYDLTESHAQVHISSAGVQADEGTWVWSPQLNLDDDNAFGVFIHSNIVRPYTVVAGSFAWLNEGQDWEPGWIQISETQGVITIAYAATSALLGTLGEIWSGPAPFAITALQMRIGGQNLDV